MSFASPVFLLALLLIPLGVVAQIVATRRRRRFAVRFPATATVAALLPHVSTWRRRIPPALLGLAAAALVFALAKPQTTVAVPVEQASVMLIQDASRSMLAEDVQPTRLEAARGAALRFLDRVPDRLQVGVVGFSTAPHTILDPTTDHEQARLTLQALIADGGTATGDAVDVAVERLQARRGAKGRKAPAAIVLLSDGKATAGVDPVAAARRAGQAGIPVYTVALGTPDGSVVIDPYQPPLAVPPDPETMRQMASASGGRAFEVSDAEQLDRIYESLGSQVGSKKAKREVSSAFAGVGLILLLAAGATGLRWRGRLP